jgi:signal recognition particle receptor subunit beta
VQGTDAIICVVDSSDVRRIDQARNSLWRLYEEYETVLRDSVLLVFANKQDCLGAMSVTEVKDRLGLEVQSERRRWHIRGSVATTGDGLMEGMEWMATQLRGSNTWSSQS